MDRWVISFLLFSSSSTLSSINREKASHFFFVCFFMAYCIFLQNYFKPSPPSTIQLMILFYPPPLFLTWKCFFYFFIYFTVLDALIIHCWYFKIEKDMIGQQDTIIQVWSPGKLFLSSGNKTKPKSIGAARRFSVQTWWSLGGVYVFCLCLPGFTPGALVSSYCPKTCRSSQLATLNSP